jgi:hypothetical protein
MKKALLMMFSAACNILQAQEISTADSTGLPGDNLELAAVLDLFKRAKSPEDFEMQLNSSESGVNNLDLNDDGKADYISVFEFNEEDSHAIVLRVNVNEKESQDIAVLAIEKTGNESARLQIIGDEAIYGSDMVAEPYDEKGALKGAGPHSLLETTVIVVNVWTWQAVRFIYAPVWKPWRSPYYWGYYPQYWKPWRPIGWRAYRKRVYGFGSKVAFGPTIYVKKAHKVYAPHKVYSPVVKVKYAHAHAWHKSHYKPKSQNGKSTNPTPKNDKQVKSKSKEVGKTKRANSPKSKAGTNPRQNKRRK